ncbi:MAG: PorP/SprF family type IX secretion system membrane protein [Saprospiraceae bacterium]|nr:PorP/SprF family type IX secretion system membrane protein [Saprospiraceae bacterium]
MKKLLLLIPFLVILSMAKAQDEAIFTHYHISPILLNPAAAGFNGNFQVQFNARAQWTGFPDAPQSFGAQFNGPIAKTFGVGVGVFSETAAQMSRMKGQLNWAFHFLNNADSKLKLSAGFSAAYQQTTLDNTVTGSNFYQPGDNLVDENLEGVRNFDASVGVFGQIMNRPIGQDPNNITRIGLSFTNLIQERLDGVVDNTNQAGQYYAFFLGHEFRNISGLGFSLEPSVMARKIKDFPSQVDINLKASFLDEQLITGVSYRTLGALGVLLGARLSNFNVYYSYDVSFQRFQKFNTGSHEITLALNFEKKQATEIDK